MVKDLHHFKLLNIICFEEYLLEVISFYSCDMIIIDSCQHNLYSYTLRLTKINTLCTNKMSKAESVFIRPRVGYRAKNDPGD